MTQMIGGKARLGGQTYYTTHTGTILLGAGRTALSAISVPCYEVFIQADPGNTTNVLIGNNIQGCTIVLTPGAGITIGIDNVNKMYGQPVAGAPRVNWIAMV